MRAQQLRAPEALKIQPEILPPPAIPMTPRRTPQVTACVHQKGCATHRAAKPFFFFRAILGFYGSFSEYQTPAARTCYVPPLAKGTAEAAHAYQVNLPIRIVSSHPSRGAEECPPLAWCFKFPYLIYLLFEYPVPEGLLYFCTRRTLTVAGKTQGKTE